MYSEENLWNPGSLSNIDGDGDDNENDKKAIALD